MQQEEVSERLDSVKREIPSTLAERIDIDTIANEKWKETDRRYHNLNTFVIVMIVVVDLIYEGWRKIEEFFFRFYVARDLHVFVVKYYSEREIYSSNIWVESFFILFFFFVVLSNTRVLFFKFQINY